MSYYFISVGGTGAKILEALTHLSVAGVIPTPATGTWREQNPRWSKSKNFKTFKSEPEVRCSKTN